METKLSGKDKATSDVPLLFGEVELMETIGHASYLFTAKVLPLLFGEVELMETSISMLQIYVCLARFSFEKGN
ncbi:hypothetical protein [Nostoc sp.]|uniref:hypothetical protein n=1 Tax=Nostoc sp. TaxID=1180 RepID=UPI003FA56849